MRLFLPLALSFAGILFFNTCTKDSLPEPTATTCDNTTPTYDAEIRPIIERTCAYSGCHLGGAPGVYDSYGGLRADLESGLFRQRVILRRSDPNVGMPPDYSPEDRPRNLTDEELFMVECWLDSGFPEN